jgi:hypothetical protein
MTLDGSSEEWLLPTVGASHILIPAELVQGQSELVATLEFGTLEEGHLEAKVTHEVQVAIKEANIDVYQFRASDTIDAWLKEHLGVYLSPYDPLKRGWKSLYTLELKHGLDGLEVQLGHIDGPNAFAATIEIGDPGFENVYGRMLVWWDKDKSRWRAFHDVFPLSAEAIAIERLEVRVTGNATIGAFVMSASPNRVLWYGAVELSLQSIESLRDTD